MGNVFLEFFGGPRRSGDFEQCIQESAAKLNVSVHVISLHNVISQRHDLLRDDLFSQLRQWCWSGVVFGLLAGHPCCTVSRARHRPGGPIPLRSREHLFGLPTAPGIEKGVRPRQRAFSSYPRPGYWNLFLPWLRTSGKP